MEPNLKDMDDYNKPLSKKKTKMIVIFFVVLLVIYGISALVQGGL